MSKEFEMNDLGEGKKILSIEITRDKRTRAVWLTYKQYLNKVFQWFGVEENTKPVTTPLTSHFKLSEKLSPSTEE